MSSPKEMYCENCEKQTEHHKPMLLLVQKYRCKECGEPKDYSASG